MLGCGGRALTAGSPQVLPQIPVKSGGPHGAGVLGEWLTPFKMPSWEGRAGLRDWGGAAWWECLLELPLSLPSGVHLEGPFISREKRGAHPEAYLRSFEANAFHDVLATYGPLDNVCIVTLAPELNRSHEVIQALTAQGIRVSLGKRALVRVACSRVSATAEADSGPHAGHSVADLRAAEVAVQCGATFITHLFNAMLPVSVTHAYSWEEGDAVATVVTQLFPPALLSSTTVTQA